MENKNQDMIPEKNEEQKAADFKLGGIDYLILGAIAISILLFKSKFVSGGGYTTDAIFGFIIGGGLCFVYILIKAKIMGRNK